MTQQTNGAGWKGSLRPLKTSPNITEMTEDTCKRYMGSASLQFPNYLSSVHEIFSQQVPNLTEAKVVN